MLCARDWLRQFVLVNIGFSVHTVADLTFDDTHGPLCAEFDEYVLFRYTIAFVVWTAGVFLLAAAARALLTSAKKLQTIGISRLKLFKRRAIHSMIILGMSASC